MRRESFLAWNGCIFRLASGFIKFQAPGGGCRPMSVWEGSLSLSLNRREEGDSPLGLPFGVCAHVCPPDLENVGFLSCVGFAAKSKCEHC